MPECVKSAGKIENEQRGRPWARRGVEVCRLVLIPRRSMNKVGGFLRAHRSAWTLLLVLAWGARIPVPSVAYLIHHAGLRAVRVSSTRRSCQSFIAEARAPVADTSPSPPHHGSRDWGLTAAPRRWGCVRLYVATILSFDLANHRPHLRAVTYPASAPVYLRRGALLI